MPRWAARTDGNQGDIIDDFEQVGASVKSVHRVGKAWDIVVGIFGRNYLFEIKTEEGKETQNQIELQETWRGQLDTIRTFEEGWQIIEDDITAMN